MNEGDLVVTADGYYGIVTDVAARLVFLGNGLEAELEEAEWNQLVSCPLIHQQGVSNFVELVRGYNAWQQSPERP